jgi:kynurenine formamidase
MDRVIFDGIAARVRNWERWGPEDARGTLNHIDGEALRRGAAEVRGGRMFSLSLPLDKDGPQLDTYRFNPRLRMTQVATPFRGNPAASMSDDAIEMPLQAATQWDALAHVHYDGVLYNGCKVCDTLSEGGAARHGIEHLATPGIVSRGVLIDVARYRGVDRLPSDHAIGIDELRAVLAHQGSEVLPGDIVLIRTGHIRHFTIDRDRVAFNAGGAGLHATCAEWLHDRRVAAIAADNLAVEQVDLEAFQGGMPLPLHMLCLRDMGMPLGEMFVLDALAADCAADGRYSFMLSGSPLPFTGAVGSPVNPVALK